jgi:hypothetical protein
MKGLLWTLAKYVLVIVVVSFLIMFVLRLMSTENFVPVTPSKEGNDKTTTPAGNVILH